MPLRPARSMTVTRSDTVPLPQGYNRTSPFPALCLVGRVRTASPPAAPDINHSSM